MLGGWIGAEPLVGFAYDIEVRLPRIGALPHRGIRNWQEATIVADEFSGPDGRTTSGGGTGPSVNAGAGIRDGPLLRHLVLVRVGECSSASCSTRAWRCDFEQARPHDKGGRADAGNAVGAASCFTWNGRSREAG